MNGTKCRERRLAYISECPVQSTRSTKSSVPPCAALMRPVWYIAAMPVSAALEPMFAPRGRVFGCEGVCPKCGYSWRAYRIHRQYGLVKCSNCAAVWAMGLVFRQVPQHMFAALIPDQSMPRADRLKLSMKTRSRKAKLAALAKLGLADAWPIVDVQPATATGPINRLEVIRDPDEP